MSTWYISALLSPDRTSSVLGIGLRGTEGGEQMGQLVIVGAVEVDGEVWPLPCSEQPESVLGQPGDGGQVDGAEAGEPAAEQLVKRHIEDCEDGDAQQRLAIQRPGTGCSPCVASQFVWSVTASPNNQCRGARWQLGSQPWPLLDPFARHPPRLQPNRLHARFSCLHMRRAARAGEGVMSQDIEDTPNPCQGSGVCVCGVCRVWVWVGGWWAGSCGWCRG